MPSTALGQNSAASFIIFIERKRRACDQNNLRKVLEYSSILVFHSSLADVNFFEFIIWRSICHCFENTF